MYNIKHRDRHEICKIFTVGRVVQEVSEISVMSNSQCNAKYGFPAAVKNHSRTLPRGIISSQLCARNKKDSGRDACDVSRALRYLILVRNN